MIIPLNLRNRINLKGEIEAVRINDAIQNNKPRQVGTLVHDRALRHCLVQITVFKILAVRLLLQ